MIKIIMRMKIIKIYKNIYNNDNNDIEIKFNKIP